MFACQFWLVLLLLAPPPRPTSNQASKQTNQLMQTSTKYFTLKLALITQLTMIQAIARQTQPLSNSDKSKNNNNNNKPTSSMYIYNDNNNS